MMSVNAFGLFWIAFLVGLIALQIGVKLAHRWQYGLDVPNDRSMHRVPIPRIGGIILFGAFILLSLWQQPDIFQKPFWGLFILVIVCFLDDLGKVGLFEKLLAQCLFVLGLTETTLDYSSSYQGVSSIIFFWALCG